MLSIKQFTKMDKIKVLNLPSLSIISKSSCIIIDRLIKVLAFQLILNMSKTPSLITNIVSKHCFTNKILNSQLG